jgi:hypothetical protein
MRHAGIVDQDGDSAEGLLRRVEGARHGAAVEHVGRHCKRAPARLLDARLDRGEPVAAARHQDDRGAGTGEHLGETHAEPARGAGDQRDAACEVEQFRSIHACSRLPRRQGGYWIIGLVLTGSDDATMR